MVVIQWNMAIVVSLPFCTAQLTTFTRVMRWREACGLCSLPVHLQEWVLFQYWMVVWVIVPGEGRKGEGHQGWRDRRLLKDKNFFFFNSNLETYTYLPSDIVDQLDARVEIRTCERSSNKEVYKATRECKLLPSLVAINRRSTPCSVLQWSSVASADGCSALQKRQGHGSAVTSSSSTSSSSSSIPFSNSLIISDTHVQIRP